MTESLSIPALLKSEAGQAFLASLEPLDRFPGRMAVAPSGLRGPRPRRRPGAAAAIELHRGAGRARVGGRVPASARGRRQGRDQGAEDAVRAGGGAGRGAAPGGRCPRARGGGPSPGDAERLLLARMLADDHPLGASQHAGRQLRYLVVSDHGPPRRFRVRQPGAAAVCPGPLDRLGRGGAFGGARPGRRDVAFPDPEGRLLPEPGLEGACFVPAAARGRLPRALRHPAPSGRDLRGGRLFRRQPVRGGMDLCRRQRGTRAAGEDRGTGSAKGGVAASADARLAPRTGGWRRCGRTAAAPAIRPRSRRRP